MTKDLLQQKDRMEKSIQEIHRHCNNNLVETMFTNLANQDHFSDQQNYF